MDLKMIGLLFSIRAICTNTAKQQHSCVAIANAAALFDSSKVDGKCAVLLLLLSSGCFKRGDRNDKANSQPEVAMELSAEHKSCASEWPHAFSLI
mmetsp:Transcript_18728/g.26554  ORF Transcript_18728/g.26554 Transcript_18728/m.26554 type:complete len:95 (+) Transcript_18728:1108-1392(+)